MKIANKYHFAEALFSLFFAFAIGVNSLAQTFVEQNGQLSVKGTKIINKDGDTVQLKGMSFFWSQWIGKYYTYNTVKWLRDDWKCTVVRPAMAIESGGYLTNPTVEKQKIFTVIDAAIDLGIYVIVDWHDHQAQRHTVAAQKFFAELAQKYGNTPNIIYEIYNEPLNVSWKDSIKPYHEAVIDSIRAYDPDNIIMCGSKTWSQDVDEASRDMIKDTNIVYTLHYYAATHKQWLRDKASTAMKNGAALFVTEYGTCESSGNGKLDSVETRTWWKFLDANKIGYCNWSVADKTETASALKPNASAEGGWDISMLSPSGIYVRDNLLGLTYYPPVVNNIENEINIPLRIFPNPVKDVLNISVDKKDGENIEIQIFDNIGKQIINSSISGSSYTVNTHELLPGIYVLKVIEGNNVSLNKFVKH